MCVVVVHPLSTNHPTDTLLGAVQKPHALKGGTSHQMEVHQAIEFVPRAQAENIQVQRTLLVVLVVQRAGTVLVQGEQPPGQHALSAHMGEVRTLRQAAQ